MGARVMPPILLLFLLPHVLSSEVGIQFCCKDGQVLSVRSATSILGMGSITSANCIPASGREGQSSLEDKFLMVLDPSRSEGQEGRHVRRQVKNLGDRNLECSSGVVRTPLQLDSQGEPTTTARPPSYDIRLEVQGSNNSMEGNVILNGKPVCDDMWGDEDATVACRMLGYMEGTATTNSRFGLAYGGDFGMDDVDCSGDEDDLFQCSYVSQDDCGESEAAGVMCRGFLGPTNSSLTVEGDLITEMGERVQADSICLAQDSRAAGRVLAVQCRNEKLISTMAGIWWMDLTRASDNIEHRGTLLTPSKNEQGKLYLTHWADQDDSNTVDTREYEELIKGNVKFIFDLLDETADGVIEATNEGKPFENIPFRLFDSLLKKVFTILDMTENDALSFNDKLDRHGRNWTGSTSLEEVFGQPPITWPHPVFKFYTTLDADQNEELSMMEAKDFLEKTFTVMDTNEDCKISIEEIVTLVTSLGMSKSYGLAVEVVLDHYFTVANFLITEFLKAADKDEDGKTTFEEIWDFDNWGWTEEMVTTALHIGYPNMGPLYYLGGQDMLWRSRRSERYKREKKLIENLLGALLNLMENPAYSAAPRGVCGRVM